METPPFQRIQQIRSQRARLAEQDDALQLEENAELLNLAATYSYPQVAAAIGVTRQRVGELCRRALARASEWDRAGAVAQVSFGRPGPKRGRHPVRADDSAAHVANPDHPPQELVERVNAEHKAWERSYLDALEHAVNCGGLLSEIRKRLRDDWRAWLDESFVASKRTAEEHIHLYYAWNQKPKDVASLDSWRAAQESIERKVTGLITTFFEAGEADA